jgi:hypothetical protein
MPHVPHLPPSTRFFGRIDRFHCECPSCGQLIVAHKDPRILGALPPGISRRRTTYNPISSVLYCPGCGMAFGVGLLLWPLRRGGGKHTVPADQQPTRRQQRELSQYMYGVWMAEARRQGSALNLAIDEDCTCPREEGGWRPGCPVHGWEAFMRRQATLDDPGPPPVPPEDGEE